MSDVVKAASAPRAPRVPLPINAWTATTPRRVVAILASALMPGAGHLVLGRRRWALGWFAVQPLAMAAVLVVGPWAAATVLLGRLGAAVHAAFVATGGAGPDTAGKSVALIVVLLLAWLAATTGLRHDFVENVTQMDGSMYPALEAGDLAVVDKTAYGVRLPFIGKVTSRAPRVGDLVAYEDPDRPDELTTGRVVIVGPGTLELRDGAIVGVERSAVAAGGGESAAAACTFVEPDQANKAIVDVPCVRFEERAGGRVWGSVQPKEGGTTMAEREVPAGMIVVAKDNRRGDKAARIVRQSAVKGRLKMLWFSTAGPRGVRWNRVGMRLPE